MRPLKATTRFAPTRGCFAHCHPPPADLPLAAPPEQVAGHLLQVAPNADPTVVQALRGGADRAVANGALEAGVAYLRRALAEPPDRDERFELLLDLGRAERRI